MKLFSILASGAAVMTMGEPNSKVATVKPHQPGSQEASAADIKIWENDVVKAAKTSLIDIKNPNCQMPKGKTLSSLGDPTKIEKHYNKLSNGNTRGSYNFEFGDGTKVYAGNDNEGETGGLWKVYCVHTPTTHVVATKSPHQQHDISTNLYNEAKEKFNRADIDGNGVITSGGAYLAFSQLFPSSTLPNIEQLLQKESISAAGKDKNVDLDEFLCVVKKLNQIKSVYAEYKKYDSSGNGKISKDELKKALIDIYFKDAVKSPIRSATANIQAGNLADQIIKNQDKNQDGEVTWDEFEHEAFMEEHYQPGDICKTSTTPISKHDVDGIEALFKKFPNKGDGSKMEISHSSWYQIVNMLTQDAVDGLDAATWGGKKPPAIGCWGIKSKNGQIQKGVTPAPRGSGNKGFGPNGGKDFGNFHKFDFNKGKGSGSSILKDMPKNLLGGRRLLDRFLQNVGAPQKVVSDKSDQTPSRFSKQPTQKLNIKQALAALHKQADSNNDGEISQTEALDIFQGVRDNLSKSDFETFLDVVGKIKGPVNCGSSTSCGACTASSNAGLCGWYENKDAGSPFGSFFGDKKSGVCKFVDRSNAAEISTDVGGFTCTTQCSVKTNNFRPILPQ